MPDEPLDDTVPERGDARTPDRAPDRFASGSVLADRYRIVERLGRGAFGEVYRAVDLRLEQDVALKFLLPHTAGDAAALAEMVHEIKTARRITHPNVCRVHDFGEVDGQPFVSMEYVRGEDLATLLKRIGPLHGDKAAQIARQICAGLQAAHEQGVLHRDLKPANVLVDEHGDVRITDFGIAAAIDRAPHGEPAGTPAYMAPELFTGASASIASDVYALGLVLYELHTGKRLFEADSMTTLLEQHRRQIVPPSAIAPGIDRETDAAILACLQRDPDDRPASAVAVLASLPGTDPLRDALARGQTPSPALVAAASGRALGIGTASGLALATIVTLALVALLDPSTRLVARAPLPIAADVLAHRAREIADALGAAAATRSTAHGFRVDTERLERLEASGLDEAGWRRTLTAERDPVLTFWYRSAAADAWADTANVKGRVTWNDPPHARPGMVRVVLDARGALRSFEARPTDEGAVAAPRSGGDPSPADRDVLALARLDLDELEPTTPTFVPRSFADERSAWLRRGDPGYRVELARRDGRPVSFIVDDAIPDRSADVARLPLTTRRTIRIVLILLAAGLALRSLRTRHSDPTGTLRAATFAFALVTGFTVLSGDHGGAWTSLFELAVRGMGHGLLVGAELAIYYLALEPHVRRIWPQTLTSWTRLLQGRLRDPQVAGSLLVGTLVGCGAAALARMMFVVARAAGSVERQPLLGGDTGLEHLTGIAPALGIMFEIGVDAIRESMIVFVVLVLLRFVLRRPLFAAAATALAFAWIRGDDFPGTLLTVVVSQVIFVVLIGLVVFSAIRYGLLALVTAYTTYELLATFPSRPDLGVWFSHSTLLPALGIGGTIALALFSLARRTR